MSYTEQATHTGNTKHASLSTYFPKGTQYFYSYPSGESSHFLNKVPPTVDELVAARALCCAGPKVSVVSFASTAAPQIDHDLLQALAIPEIPADRLTLLPQNINISLCGKERNDAIMTALAKSVAPGSLVMAQPYVDKELESLYEIPPHLTIWLNDKSHMHEYIKSSMMPERLAQYASGADFANDRTLLSRRKILPCVVKVSSSSSGDGVYICHTKDDIAKAQDDVRLIDVTVLIERFIVPVKNYAVHFGIPFDKSQPIDIIGFNEQLTTDDGEFLGGLISNESFPDTLQSVKEYLQHTVLPTIRNMGWYGIGGYDVIVDADGNTFLIDGNFRMTGMSAYHFLVANGTITKPLVSFSGQFKGSRKDFETAIMPFAGKDSAARTIQLIAISRHDNEWHFNGALLYRDQDELKQTVQQLRQKGIYSPALEQF